MALRYGTPVRIGGVLYNAGGKKATAAVARLQKNNKEIDNNDGSTKKEQVIPAPVETPATPVSPPSPVINLDTSALVASNERLSEVINKVLETKQPGPAAPVTQWTFDIIRDNKGLIKSMTAKASAG